MSPGEKVYNYYNPPMLKVVLASKRHFATKDDIFLVTNENYTPYKYLTQKCKDSWEKTAIGHHIFTKEKV